MQLLNRILTSVVTILKLQNLQRTQSSSSAINEHQSLICIEPGLPQYTGRQHCCYCTIISKSLMQLTYLVLFDKSLGFCIVSVSLAGASSLLSVNLSHHTDLSFLSLPHTYSNFVFIWMSNSCAVQKGLIVGSSEYLSLGCHKPFGVTLERFKQVEGLDYARDEAKFQVSTRVIKSINCFNLQLTHIQIMCDDRIL